MSCRRCHGMMITDHLNDEGGRPAQPVWRCLLCGEIVDSTILTNRKNQPKPASS